MVGVSARANNRRVERGVQDRHNILTLEDFKTWSDDALCCFLSLRSMDINGSSAELAARAFVCWEQKIPANESQEHRLRRDLNSYAQKLVINGTVIPDPFTIANGWLDESLSKTMWPPVFITDIADFLRLRSSSDLINRLCNEYKQGKAYRLVDNFFAATVFMFCFSSCEVSVFVIIDTES